jgi:hypothetical protein
MIAAPQTVGTAGGDRSKWKCRLTVATRTLMQMKAQHTTHHVQLPRIILIIIAGMPMIQHTGRAHEIVSSGTREVMSPRQVKRNMATTSKATMIRIEDATVPTTLCQSKQRLRLVVADLDPVQVRSLPLMSRESHSQLHQWALHHQDHLGARDRLRTHRL